MPTLRHRPPHLVTRKPIGQSSCTSDRRCTSLIGAHCEDEARLHAIRILTEQESGNLSVESDPTARRPQRRNHRRMPLQRRLSLHWLVPRGAEGVKTNGLPGRKDITAEACEAFHHSGMRGKGHQVANRMFLRDAAHRIALSGNQVI